MTEKEVLEMIKESAEKEKMPDALRPEQIKEKLQATKQKKQENGLQQAGWLQWHLCCS